MYALAALAVCVGTAWLIFGNSDDNWMVQHSLYLNESLSQAPSNTTVFTRFTLVTFPALIFSPFAEELLYRGCMISGFSKTWGVPVALCIKAFAFALVHLTHYGLNPVQPSLIAVWLPSMFFVALVLGWIVLKNNSIWVAFLSHRFFNFRMNGLVFLFLPDLVCV
ncbi:MAG: CPBP family intramembrane glutamic endopeptidase [Rhodohalobacter sp.]|uniref:CPBP family intramembrane glutamic endopeptidase n=1 Tax=Rhodohalobacter sp. TaxID=1974210 RepID=UPI0039764F02